MNFEDKQFAVVGLGRFGLAVCQELVDSGAQVLAVDVDEELVKMAANIATQAIVANCTHEETVKELKLNEYDMVMVSIGENVNASMLATLVIKDSGAKSVWVKANDKAHIRILQKIGADHIIMPERDMGSRVARKMLDKRVLEFQELGSGLAMTEIVIGSRWMGSQIGQLPFSQDKEIMILGFKRGAQITPTPASDIQLEIGDLLIVVGPQKELTKRLKAL